VALRDCKIGLAGKDICNRQGHLQAAPRAIEQRVLGGRHQRITCANRLDRLCQLHFPGTALAAGRDGGNEAAPGSRKRCLRGRIVSFQYDDLGHQALGHRLMPGDVVLMQCRQARVQ
jgi:hypothetical protein